MLKPKPISRICFRNFKNFGHKRQPIPLVTTFWHGSLTLMFTGMCLNWEKLSSWVGVSSNKLEHDQDDDTS